QVVFDDRVVDYDFMLLDELELAYAATVHKSQGSEFDAIIMPMCETHRLLMTRNLLYTAITRAKKLVVLVGQEDVIKLYVNNDNIQKRFSGLKNRMSIF
ncbi:MAG: ATP-binding domain-containing protein, partial [Monoglobaceae bacterium]